MKKFVYSAFALGALSLAACGGGSSTTTPVAMPSTAPSQVPVPVPSVAPAFTLTWSGAAQKATTASSALRLTMAVPTPYPIVVDNPDSTQNPAGSGDTEAIVNVVASPAPSTSPVWTVNATTLMKGPGASGTSITVAQTTFPFAGTGSVSATVAGVTQTLPVYIFERINVSCHTASGLGTDFDDPGESFSNGVQTHTTTRAASDIYFTGTDCSGDFNDPGDLTLHTPYGATLLLSQNTAFLDISTAQFSATPITSFDMKNFYQPGVIATFDSILFKTSSGQFVKAFFTRIGPNTVQPQLTGPFATHGFSVDNF